jgi:hypothetical protein
MCLGAFGIAANVLSGAYVFEITTNNPSSGTYLDWYASYASPSFWMLCASWMATGLYGWGMTRYERRIQRELARAEPTAKALEVLLDPLIRRAEEDIRKGRLKSLEEIKKMFSISAG